MIVVRSALRELGASRTTIIISHRLSSLLHADEILFLEGGHVIERGNHETLLALGGRYRDLYQLQAHGRDDGAPAPEEAPPGALRARPA